MLYVRIGNCVNLVLHIYHFRFTGPPYFTKRNKLVLYAALRKLLKFYFYVVSGSAIHTSLPGINNISISSKDIDDVIYDVNVKVTGYEIMVDTLLEGVEDFGNFTIQLTNSAGTTKFEFEVKAAGNHKNSIDLNKIFT